MSIIHVIQDFLDRNDWMLPSSNDVKLVDYENDHYNFNDDREKGSIYRFKVTFSFESKLYTLTEDVLRFKETKSLVCQCIIWVSPKSSQEILPMFTTSCGHHSTLTSV